MERPHDLSSAPSPDDHYAWQIDRPRGVLSKQDRAWLLDDEKSKVGKTAEDPARSERGTRHRIRERIFNAFLDFTLIFLYLPSADRKLIFGNSNRSDEKEIELWSGAIYALAFLYERLTEEQDYQNFEYTLEAAILAVLDSPSIVRETKYEPIEVDWEEDGINTLYAGHSAPMDYEIKVEIDTSRLVDLGRVGKKINEEGWLSLTEEDVEAVKVMLRSGAGDNLHPEFREHLSSIVEALEMRYEQDEGWEEKLAEALFRRENREQETDDTEA